MPPRSYFYPLQPQGVGTGEVEGVWSYLLRLASAHGVAPAALLEELRMSVGLGHNSHGDSTLLKATTPHPWILALADLTVRPELPQTTLIGWSEVISERGMYKDDGAYCPHCYEEMRAFGRTIYTPLLWSIDGVTDCPRHACPLSTSCPICGAQTPLLPARGQPSYCPVCSSWLGRPSEPLVGPDTPEDLVASLLKHPIASSIRPEHKDTLWFMLSIAPELDYSQLSRRSQTPHSLLRGWIRGDVLPTMKSVVRFARAAGLSLLDIALPFRGFLSAEITSLLTLVMPRDSVQMLQSLKWPEHFQSVSWPNGTIYAGRYTKTGPRHKLLAPQGGFEPPALRVETGCSDH